MPFQPIDFANIKPQGNPFFRDLVENLATGYKAGQLPQQLERQRQKEELVNAMQKILLEEQPQKFGEESQGRQLGNDFQRMINQQQPQKFGSEQATAAMQRALQQANINRTNTMTPLEARELALKNQLYPELTKSQIANNLSLTEYRKSSGTVTNAGAKAERDFQNSVAKDNPQLTPEQVYDASNAIREGRDTLEDGTKLNPLSQSAQGALDRLLKSGTTATVTANKKATQAIDNVLPLIAELKDMYAPGPIIGKYLSPNKNAAYDAKIAEIKDSLAIAMKLPQTHEGLATIHTMVARQPAESDKSYYSRLTDLEKSLRRRQEIATAPQKISNSSSTLGKVEEEGTYKGKPVVKVNGKWHYK